MAHRCNVKMYPNQIKHWKSLSKIIVSRVEGCSPFAFDLLRFRCKRAHELCTNRACSTFQMVDGLCRNQIEHTMCLCIHRTHYIIPYRISIKSVLSKCQHPNLKRSIQTLRLLPSPHGTTLPNIVYKRRLNRNTNTITNSLKVETRQFLKHLLNMGKYNLLAIAINKIYWLH